MSDFSYCGMDCKACPVLQASQNKDYAHKQWLVAEYSFEEISFSADQLTCHGCKSHAANSQICSQCSIRACATARVEGTCAECANYPCALISRFVAVETDARNVLDYLHESLTV